MTRTWNTSSNSCHPACSVLGNTAAYEKVWIIGDDFMLKSFGPSFQKIYEAEDRQGYIRQHYDITGACSGSLSVSLMKRNVISRLLNNYIELINDQVLLPKAVVVVIEGDLLDSLNHYKTGAADGITPCTNWLTSEFHRVTVAHKEKLNSKSRKFCYPYLLFTAAVYHDGFRNGNAYREKFNDCLKTATQKLRGVSTFYLHSWNGKDLSSVSHGTLNAKGCDRYWETFNDTFQAWDKALMRSQQFNTSQHFCSTSQPNYQSKGRCNSHPYDRFHWRKH